MEQLTLFNILLLLSGFSLHILLSIQKVLKGTAPFSFGRWLQENWVNALISIICAFTSLALADDMIKMLDLTTNDGSPFYKFHAFISGYLGRDLIFRSIQAFQNKNK